MMVQTLRNIALLAALVFGVFILTDTQAKMQQEAPQPPDPMGVPGSQEARTVLEQELNRLETGGAAPRLGAGAGQCLAIAAENVQAACWSALELHFSNYEERVSIRNRAFHWQHASTVIIFVIVHLIVLVGLYLSWRQFQLDIELRRHLKETARQGPNTPAEQTIERQAPRPATEIELSLTSLKASSSVIGLIILTLSLAFFYLYLETVYPLRTIPDAPLTNQTGAQQK